MYQNCTIIMKIAYLSIAIKQYNNSNNNKVNNNHDHINRFLSFLILNLVFFFLLFVCSRK